MFKLWKLPFKLKSISARPVLVICGAKCWTSKVNRTTAVSSTPWISLVPAVPPPKMSPLRSLPKLKPKNRWDNAARVIAVLPVRVALQVPMDTMAPTDSLANPEIVDQPLQIPALAAEMVKNNARARLPLVTEDHKDREEPTDPPAMLAPPALTEDLALVDPLDHPAQLARQEMQVLMALKAMLDTLPDHTQAQPVQPDPTVIPALLAQLVNPAQLAKMAVPAAQAVPEMLVPQAVLVTLAAPAVQANPANLVLQAVANTAHQLVWLQVIKRQYQRTSFCGNTQFRQKLIYSKRPSMSSNLFPKCISDSFVFTSQF